MRVQGKSYKELKEAFIKLRASFNYAQKQVEAARASRDENSKEIASLKKERDRLEAKINKIAEANLESLKKLKSDNRNKLAEYRSNIASLNRKISLCENRINDYKSKINSYYRLKYLQSKRIETLKDKLKDKSSHLRKSLLKIKRLENRKPPKVRPKVKSIKEKVYVTRVVKEPIPDKMRQLMSSNTITQSKMDILLISTTLLKFSDITKLTLRQMVILLEANNLRYFVKSQLLTYNAFTLKELEYKNLIRGDRPGGKRAKGWFITEKGRRVAEMLLKKAYNSNNLKKEYLKYGN